MPDQNLRDHLQRRVSSLRLERQSFMDMWRDVADFAKPRRGRFLISDRNKGDKSRWNKIINNAATRASRTARAGLLSGVMSPSRPWFQMEPFDPGLKDRPKVKEYLHKVRNIKLDIFNASNLYNMAPSMLEELLLFATGAMGHVDDFEDVARFYTYTIGEYMIGLDKRKNVAVFAREYEQTIYQIVDEFGLENVSPFVRNQYDVGHYDQWAPVTHVIEPNPNADASRPEMKFKPYRSYYYEPGSREPDKFLSRSGFNEFPIYVPRWEVTSEDIYGTNCPGMTALGDVKGLQVQERRKAQGIDKQVNPPLQGPATLKNTPVTALPGGLNLFDTGAQDKGIRPIYEVQPDVNALREDIRAVERRIDWAFYTDLFLAITTMEGIQPRNEMEIAERNAERLLQVGPVLEQLHGEFLNRLIDRTFAQCDRAGILPEPPEELRGQPLRTRYISSLAMAQRAVATTGIERVAGFAGMLVKNGLTDGKKFDADQAIDEYAGALGVAPGIVVPDDQVREQRAVEQAALAQQQAAETLQAGANAAQAASGAKLDDDNVLSRMVGRS